MAATDVGGNAEAIETGKSGFIVPPRDPEALAQSLITILTQPELAETMSVQARERSTLFCLDTMRARTDKLYRSLLAAKGKL